MCRECEQLRMKVDDLREQVRAWERYDATDIVEAGEITQVRRFGFSAQQSAILLALARRPDRDVLQEALLRFMTVPGSCEAGPTSNTLRVQMASLRKTLRQRYPSVRVETVWGFGYRMDRRSAEQVRGWLSDLHPAALQQETQP